MLDGILDLLTAVLVLGIVVAIAFSFILPLVDTEYMQFDIQYEDKAVLSNNGDYADPETSENLIRRMYTYEELILLLNVQDSRMAAPKGINFRNLSTTVNLTGYSESSKGDYDLVNTYDTYDLNDFYDIANVGLRTKFQTDEVYQGIVKYADNHYEFMGTGENSTRDPTSSIPDGPNIGFMGIGEAFSLSSDAIANELNGKTDLMDPTPLYKANVMGPQKTVSSNAAAGAYNAYLNSLEEYEKQRIYFISYRFAIPDETEYMDTLTEYHRNYDEEDAFFVEIKGEVPSNIAVNSAWPTYRVDGKYYIDTFKGYQYYLSQVRKDISVD